MDHRKQQDKSFANRRAIWRLREEGGRGQGEKVKRIKMC